MLLSAAIAALLALYTSRLIARPLQIVTNVARKITQESNFQLRANVTTKDEVVVHQSYFDRLLCR
ncbi:hypothetical protein FNW02_08445 [Komarekiella sp. 'clone 1']|uniref:HAMP domain-containing protein n=1 Tax=Komarekiella delphini-convector SJRDD-AB1 TaxID=2593771 RepID=A0AA40VQK6_9NOST|nr:hypothetical protein [Komarekiella delphini-convector]MBD6615857.1 hypothetical protein [Komarekiella delphini-convector SJRDD-AB1]